jgi:lysozyme
MYVGPQGKLLVGIGYNIQDKGLPDDVIWALFKYALDEAWLNASKLPGYSGLDEARQGVLAAMVYQIGYAGVLDFKRMLRALVARDYDRAADEMLDSVWFKQTPHRATREAAIMRSGKVPALELPSR